MSRIVVIGGGPTGLGAAWRLHELGHDDWVLLEATQDVGGLASSVVDEQGFTWDLGGHVLFSHYDYFDALMDALLADAWYEHVREAWVWMRDRFIPYPFQNNIWRLPADDLIACLDGLVDLHARRDDPPPPSHFGEWIRQSFGDGIADVFMEPYNFKVWAYPPAAMNTGWMGDRVATVDLKRILANLVHQRDEVSWGPNATFRFPARGGTGAIWSSLGERLPTERVAPGRRVIGVDAARQVVRCDTGEEFGYDALVSTMPLDELLGVLTGLPGGNAVTAHRDRFVWSSSHIVGIGLGGAVPEHLRTKCWMYFPEPETPFYRVTVFSNYSPNNVARPGEQWSLMCEISESAAKPVDHARVLDDTIAGLRACRLVSADDEIVSTWHRRLPKGYPTPFLARDAVLADVEPALRAAGIYSRGRFGGWKYEVSNQDHSLMQGVEAVNHVLCGEDELTWFDPTAVNGR
ncbi:MAG: FAD-dependent oxidoreductase [Acidimicrobiales bacterium]|nr:FAD-dependent oxidoreductase [Acidimicrobiales bacterium]